MEGLDLLGASDALSNQYITFRIKNIDSQTLKYKLGTGTAGALAPAGLLFVNAGPQAALDVAAPFIRSAMKDYGIDADVTVSKVAPAGGPRAISEFWPGLLVGGVIGGSGLLIVKMIARLFARR